MSRTAVVFQNGESPTMLNCCYCGRLPAFSLRRPPLWTPCAPFQVYTFASAHRLRVPLLCLAVGIYPAVPDGASQHNGFNLVRGLRRDNFWEFTVRSDGLNLMGPWAICCSSVPVGSRQSVAGCRSDRWMLCWSGAMILWRVVLLLWPLPAAGLLNSWTWRPFYSQRVGLRNASCNAVVVVDCKKDDNDSVRLMDYLQVTR